MLFESASDLDSVSNIGMTFLEIKIAKQKRNYLILCKIFIKTPDKYRVAATPSWLLERSIIAVTVHPSDTQLITMVQASESAP
jgi:hypothetical protein